MSRAHTLVTREDKARLRQAVEEIERETGVEIAALVVPDTTHIAPVAGAPDQREAKRLERLEQFATSYFNHLRIGKREHHNGVLILIVVDRRQVRIEVGHGLEHVVTRDAASRIIAEVMAPELRRGRYGEALIRGAGAIRELVRAASGAPRRNDGEPSRG